MKQFHSKLNVRRDKKPYVIEEEKIIQNGSYEGFLSHDNVDEKTIQVYSSKRLEGEKVNSVAISKDDDFPWRTYIRINSSFPKVHVSYETIGDTVEAEDVNELQEAITETYEDLQSYKQTNDTKTKQLRSDVNSLDNRKAEKTYVDSEFANRYIKSEVYTKQEADSRLNTKAEKEATNRELANRYIKSEVYTKTETDNRIQNVVGSAPQALDTLKEIADALGNDRNFAATVTNELTKKAEKEATDRELANRYVKSEVYTKQEADSRLNTKVDKVSNKQLSTEDFTTAEKQKLARIEEQANKYVHPSTHQASMIVENAQKRFVSDVEKSRWNEVSSKLDTQGGEISETVSIFSESQQRENIASGEKTKTIFSKIAKFFSDLKNIAFTGSWNDLVDKPTTFPPANHTHDDRYYTESEINTKLNAKANASHTHTKEQITDFTHRHTWNEVDGKPTTFPPTNHTHDDRYYTESEMDTKLNAKANASHTHTKEQIINFAHRHDIGEIINFPSADISDLKANKHTHSNKIILDAINQEVLNRVSSAFLHSSDSIKHITALERQRWDQVDQKVNRTDADRIYATKSEISTAGYGDMLKSVYDTNDDGKVDVAKLAESVAWGSVSGKPTTFPPANHTHDDRYYTESEMDTKLNAKANASHTHTKEQIINFAHRHTWNEVDGKPNTFPPTNHTHDDRYYTESEINTKLDTKANASHNHNSIYFTKTEIDNRIKKPLTWGNLKGGL